MHGLNWIKIRRVGTNDICHFYMSDIDEYETLVDALKRMTGDYEIVERSASTVTLYRDAETVLDLMRG